MSNPSNPTADAALSVALYILEALKVHGVVSADQANAVLKGAITNHAAQAQEPEKSILTSKLNAKITG